MNLKTSLIGALFLLLSAASFAAEKETAPVASTPPAAAPAISQEEFALQRENMIKDLDRKIRLLSEAKACAVKSTTPSAVQECNKALRQGITNHMNDMQTEANKKAK